MKKYVLISVIEREINTEQFDKLSFAREEMRRQFSIACGGGEYVEEKIDSGEARLEDYYNSNTHGAWVTDGVNHDNYDWKIIEIEIDIDIDK